MLINNFHHRSFQTLVALFGVDITSHVFVTTPVNLVVIFSGNDLKFRASHYAVALQQWVNRYTIIPPGSIKKHVICPLTFPWASCMQYTIKQWSTHVVWCVRENQLGVISCEVVYRIMSLHKTNCIVYEIPFREKCTPQYVKYTYIQHFPRGTVTYILYSSNHHTSKTKNSRCHVSIIFRPDFRPNISIKVF